MHSLTRTSTRLHANACQLRERRACDTATTQGAWLLAPPLLSMGMKRENAYKPVTGAECMLNHLCKTEVPLDASYRWHVEQLA
jgi:hypothetical protein